MSWTVNKVGECNNPACKDTIYWNELIRHPVTGRQRPLSKPYYPDQGQAELHQCMKDKRPNKFIQKYPMMTADQLRRYHEIPGYTPAQVEDMKDPVIKAAWNQQREEWLEKWER